MLVYIGILTLTTSSLWYWFDKTAYDFYSTSALFLVFQFSLKFYSKCPTHVLLDYSKFCALKENPGVSRRKSDLVPATFLYLSIWHLE